MDNTEDTAQPSPPHFSEKKVQTDEPMPLEVRAAHYASPGPYRNPKTGKFAKQPVRAGGTGPQHRRLKHKENRAIAKQVRAVEAKVAKLRGAAKTSAQKTLDRLKKHFK